MGAEGIQHLAGLGPFGNKVRAAQDKPIHPTSLKLKMMRLKLVELNQRRIVPSVLSCNEGWGGKVHRNSCHCNNHRPITALKT